MDGIIYGRASVSHSAVESYAAAKRQTIVLYLIYYEDPNRND